MTDITIELTLTDEQLTKLYQALEELVLEPHEDEETDYVLNHVMHTIATHDLEEEIDD